MMLASDQVWELVGPRLNEYYKRTAGELNAVARFVGAQPETVLRWANGGRASGEKLLKLWHFLRAVGLQSPEFRKLDQYNVRVGELFAFDIVDMDTLYRILNVKQTDAVYETIRGRSPMHPTYLLEYLDSTYGSALEAAKATLTQLSPVNPASSASAPHQPSPATPPQSIDPSAAQPSSANLDCVEVANTLNQALVIMRFLASGVCPPETVQLILRLAGDISEFSQLTGALAQP